ncbi:hypothetical protein OROMI_006634 [Orobanche minor]
MSRPAGGGEDNGSAAFMACRDVSPCRGVSDTATATSEKSRCFIVIATQLLGQLDGLLPHGTPGHHRRRIEVATRVSQDDAGGDEWFVVKVIHFENKTREFEELDEEPGDDEESGGPRKYKLPMTHIISFPKRTDLSNVQDFPPGRHVLAVYPETTALYKATVFQARK